jgi:hypothetical protein
MLFLFHRHISGKEFKIFPPLFFGFDKPVLAFPNLAHLLSPFADINAIAKSKELNPTSQQIGALRTLFARALDLPKSAPQAYGIFLFCVLFSFNSYSQIISSEAERIKQQNYELMKMQGYQPPILPPTDPTLAHHFILHQYDKTDPKNSAYNKERELKNVLSEFKNDERINDYKSNYFTNNNSNSAVDLTGYQNAFDKINNMLSGKAPLSMKDAYYYAETAYGGSYISKTDYDNTINESADFIKKWLQQNNIPLTQSNLQLAIQDFMSDTLALKIYLPDNKEKYKIKTHAPFKYDYDDYQGKQDYRNYFVTKCFATGTGQCSSMPSAHLIISEKLGVSSYLTFAPFHSFIKFKDAKGNIANYEPTSNWSLPDKWYQEHLFISPEAKKSGVYLDTLNKKQVVANCLVDMVVSYLSKTSNPDTAFTNQCLSKARKYFPKNNNIYIHLAKSQILNYQLYHSMEQHNIKDVSQIPANSDTNKIYQRLLKNEQLITTLGYQDLPKDMYDQLIEQQNNKTKDNNAKTSKTLFQLH